MKNPIRPNQGIGQTKLTVMQQPELGKHALVLLWLTEVGLKMAQASVTELANSINPNREFLKLLAEIRKETGIYANRMFITAGKKITEQVDAINDLFAPVGGLQTVFIQLSMVNECDMDRCVDEILATIDRHLPKKETNQSANFENMRTLLESKGFEIQEHASSYKATYKKLTIDVTNGNLAFVSCVGYESKIQLWEWTVGEVCQIIEPLIFKQNTLF